LAESDANRARGNFARGQCIAYGGRVTNEHPQNRAPHVRCEGMSSSDCEDANGASLSTRTPVCMLGIRPEGAPQQSGPPPGQQNRNQNRRR
jgi:hypothetical protein